MMTAAVTLLLDHCITTSVSRCWCVQPRTSSAHAAALPILHVTRYIARAGDDDELIELACSTEDIDLPSTIALVCLLRKNSPISSKCRLELWSFLATFVKSLSLKTLSSAVQSACKLALKETALFRSSNAET